MKIEESSFEPFYYQIKKKLLYQIETGELKENEKLPSEMELSKEFGVSRPTVRKALEQLVFAGYLKKKKGKGTFVSSNKLKENLSVFTPFVESAQAIGKSPKIKTISRKNVYATEELAELLDISIGDELVEMVILRLTDGEPVNLKNTYYPKSIFPDFFDNFVDDIPYYGLLEHYLMDRNLIPIKYVRNFEVVISSEAESNYLKVEEEIPLILWEDIMYLNNGKPAELSRTFYRSDRYNFYIEQNIESTLLVKEKNNNHDVIEHR